MESSTERARLGLLVTLLAVLVVGIFQIRADAIHPPGSCPLCHTEGIPVPERDQLSKCECEKWWNGQAPARLMFADCSSRDCAERGPHESHEWSRLYVDLQLYRCPKDGLLFTEPE